MTEINAVISTFSIDEIQHSYKILREEKTYNFFHKRIKEFVYASNIHKIKISLNIFCT